MKKIILLFMSFFIISNCFSDEIKKLEDSIEQLNKKTVNYVLINNLILKEISKTGTISSEAANNILKKLESINPNLFPRVSSSSFVRNIGQDIMTDHTNPAIFDNTLINYLDDGFRLSSSGSVYADIDKDYGKKTVWWTSAYKQILSYLGIEKSYALVVGIGSYKDKTFSHLPSEKDAVRIKNYLVNEAGFDNVHLITGNRVTRKRIYELMSHYQKIITNKDRFLFYWSGHGVTDGSNRKTGYLPVYASTNNAATMISMLQLKNWDDGLKAKQTLYLLDACFSGIAASKSMGISQKQTIERVNRPSRQILTAGLEGEETIAINDLGGSVFTRALLDGLRGHADTNKGMFKKDNVVTARELEEYVRERVDHERRRVRWKKPITPVLYNFSQYAGDFFFIADKSKLQKIFLTPVGTSPTNKVIPTGVYSKFPTSNKKEKKLSLSKEKEDSSNAFMGNIFSGNAPSSADTKKTVIFNGNDYIRIRGNVMHGLIISENANVVIDGNLFGGIKISGNGKVYVKGNAYGTVHISGNGNVHINGNAYGNMRISDMGSLNLDGTMTGNIFLSGVGVAKIKGKHIGRLVR